MTDSPTFTRVVRVPRTGSTNADLRDAAAADPDAWPHLSVLVADHQDAGRGRAGRSWETPPGQALTASVLLRTAVPADRLGWVPLLAGLAVQRACGRLLPAGVRTGVKWPNDVLAVDAGAADVEGWGRDRKVAGILAEVVPGGSWPSAAGDASGHAATAVVLGIGLNVAQRELPVPWAASLRLLGADVDPATALDLVGEELVPLVHAWEAAGGDADAAGLRDQVRAVCATLGLPVRAELPGGAERHGRAVDLDADGRLLIDTGVGVEAVAAGDVRHIRTPPTAR
ncbi:BirA family biotin operon repressor/biotin-[acetyl-CoA-carboxylase] ligase [Georgenia soli]|uniref:biotin--[biotin carboxyl-carrier protein] ligase n=1 Tax=Georgenia soli TaxID=638953 RepID=A0A2A9EKI1_9MICO|nr:biotin--[acetyl-CoA-carboxylase] ligase [Georgenia soli]PFG38729.1 BirA family biotin operon repressor/biotin-[acetyl-CoA-carboxylase] ligase [Georgenia soli]